MHRKKQFIYALKNSILLDYKTIISKETTAHLDNHLTTFERAVNHFFFPLRRTYSKKALIYSYILHFIIAGYF